ncbi:MAG: inositol monophosphatase [Opitutia bacterium Tous-C1TDCM]|nr:MAG: inositol monophosphatase [Opitutae bacterium Tous-C1TDCM]
MNRAMLERARRLLCALQAHIRDTIVAARRREAGKFARIAAVTAADTIYHVDRLSEEAILAWFEAHWPHAWPVELVMEGLEEGGTTTFPRGTPVGRTQWKCILDPIDGTRGLMYDKRSAFILAGLAPQRGPRTHLGDIAVAAMTEIPVSKQDRADQLSAVRGGGVKAETADLVQGTRRRWTPRPSQARGFGQGFASFARFFPEGKALLGALEEDLWRELGLLGKNGGQQVFDDQYICTGGQLFELVVGHDRMLGDLRPLAYAKLGYSAASLCCHPYDICTALIAREAGCLVERPEGGALRVPLDTTTPVAWVGFANGHLARLVRPMLRRILAARL